MQVLLQKLQEQTLHLASEIHEQTSLIAGLERELQQQHEIFLQLQAEIENQQVLRASIQAEEQVSHR